MIGTLRQHQTSRVNEMETTSKKRRTSCEHAGRESSSDEKSTLEIVSTSTTNQQSQSQSQPQPSKSIPTATQFVVPPSDFLKLPAELEGVDFTKRISWRKYKPYHHSSEEKGATTIASSLPITSIGTKPEFTSLSPALCFHVHGISGRARATTVHLPRGRAVPTPMFMPVGTKGTIKSLTTEEIIDEEALNCPIILGNTYHLALQPGTDLIRDMGGLHQFMGWDRGILTDSGGFQMVSLLKLAEITEEGVAFENPFKNNEHDLDSISLTPEQKNTAHGDLSLETGKSDRLLLRPEDSITHQNNIGSDIMMALDDVVSSVADNEERFTIATYRTLRWLDRCYAAHKKPLEQNLFPIVQGGLDTSLGGLREKCLAGFRLRDSKMPGYAIGGLAGGESKDDFWRVVDQCCKALPDDKPRYLMGVGYPLDLVVCSALGVDMYDCVYPTRTGRFGVALVPGESPGTMKLKSNEYSNDPRVIMEGCKCIACKGGISRARLHFLLKSDNPLAATLLTHHNIAYMMFLVRGMREAIMNDTYGDYVRNFVNDQFRGKQNGGQDTPKWVVDALHSAGIQLQ